MPLKRKFQWERALAGRIFSARELAFAWGTFDCAIWTCDWIRDATGVDPAASYRGKYSSEAEAIAIFGSSLGNFAATIAAQIGAKEVRPTYARRGDVVFVDNATEYGCLGIVNLDGRHAACVAERDAAGAHEALEARLANRMSKTAEEIGLIVGGIALFAAPWGPMRGVVALQGSDAIFRPWARLRPHSAALAWPCGRIRPWALRTRKPFPKAMRRDG